MKLPFFSIIRVKQKVKKNNGAVSLWLFCREIFSPDNHKNIIFNKRQFNKFFKKNSLLFLFFLLPPWTFNSFFMFLIKHIRVREIYVYARVLVFTHAYVLNYTYLLRTSEHVHIFRLQQNRKINLCTFSSDSWIASSFFSFSFISSLHMLTYICNFGNYRINF